MPGASLIVENPLPGAVAGWSRRLGYRDTTHFRGHEDGSRAREPDEPEGPAFQSDGLMLRRLRDHSLTASLILALPLLPIFEAWYGGASYGWLMFKTGEWATRFLVASLAITPLGVLFGRLGWWRWLRRRRRHIGVAAFLYTCLHTVLYLRELGAISTIAAELALASIWTAWLSLALMLPLAVTSTDAAVRRMGRSWLTLHRLAYPATVLAALHWYLVEGHLRPVLINFGPLVVLELLRIWRPRKAASGSMRPEAVP